MLNAFTDDERNKLESVQTGAETNVQSDWNQTDTGADDYINNKPVTYEVKDACTDADNATETGLHPITNATLNLPAGSLSTWITTGYLRVTATNSTALCQEVVATDYDTSVPITSPIFYRMKDGGSWSDWARITKYSDLVQSDWNQSNSAELDYIKNKPDFTHVSGGGYFIAPVTTLMTNSGQDYKVDTVFTEWPGANDIEYDSINHRFNYTGTGGTLLLVCVFSAANDTNNTKMTYMLCKNGSPITGASATTDFINNNKDQRMGILATVTAATNDYFELCVQADAAGTNAYTSHCQVSVR